MFALGAILPSILLFVSHYIMPESPRWLVAKGKENEALIVLQKIYPEGYPVETIIEDIKTTMQKETEASKAVTWDALLFHPTPSFRRMLYLGLFIAAAQQLVGIEGISYYLIFILDEAGLEDRNSQYVMLIYFALLKTMYIFSSGRFFDKWGRRVFIFISLAGKYAFHV